MKNVFKLYPKGVISTLLKTHIFFLSIYLGESMKDFQI